MIETSSLPWISHTLIGWFLNRTTIRFNAERTGGIDLDRVTAIRVMEVIDYH